MREILFRGKDIKTKEWVEGYYVKSKLHWHKRGVHEDWIITSAFSNGGYFSVAGRCAVDKDTVCEFTGLKDKNGTKIFEHDIVHVITPNTNNNFEVKFDYGQFFIGINMAIAYVRDSCEVIGNIFDNQELIK